MTEEEEEIVQEECVWCGESAPEDEGERDLVLSRIASLSGGIGVIYVGGNTDLEQKELYDRVDDAVCAVRSALLEGILPGGGLALYQEHKRLSKGKSAAQLILADALKAPCEQILSNADLNIDDIYHSKVRDGVGYDVKQGEYGDMMEMGIIDPMRVTKVALQNAVSVASTIISTNAIITQP